MRSINSFERALALLCAAALTAPGCGPRVRVAASPAPTHAAAQNGSDSFALVAEADRLGALDLWPGFDARAVPIAIYDGETTLLFRHPSPPPDFVPMPGHPGVQSYGGRHPAVTANSSADIGGMQTATLMPAPGNATPYAVSARARAGIVIHEAFHVFQRTRHPAWSANEAELFVYPVDDVGLFTLRSMEAEALRRALSAPNTRDDRVAGCWARAAMALRAERFGAMPAGSVAYERQTELNEGLAAYVERRATGAPDSTLPGTSSLGPEAIRLSAYGTGPAIARLLDRFSPQWRAALEQKDSVPLDVMLSSTLPPDPGSSRCLVNAVERARFRADADAAIASLAARRAESRRAFLERAGWRLVITAAGSPLFPQGFDPLNVQAVGGGQVLHARFLKLGNDRGAIEVIGRASLTEPAGQHPLFNGVRTLTITGLAEEPVITEASGSVAIKAEGVAGELRGAKVERAGRTVTIRLP